MSSDLKGAASPDVTRSAIAATYTLIRPFIRKTPVIEVEAGDFGLEGTSPLLLKLELFQHAGSFKARGAFANLLMRKAGPAGVTAASGGNHGVAVALAARKLNVPATIFVPEISSPAKRARIAELGAELVVKGQRYADALGHCQAFMAKSGALGVHAYDAPQTLLGQGTLALELEAQAPKLDTLLVAVGGGGLIAGIAAASEGRLRIIGVEPQTSTALHSALAAGRPVDVEVSGIAADSLGARSVGERVFPIARALVEDVVLVDDAAIRDAQLQLWKSVRAVAEPGGAAAFAALLSGAYRAAPGERVGVLVCGANTDAVAFS